MDTKLVGKTALVTGTSKGIGRAIARALSREGVKLALTARSVHDLDTLADAIEAEGFARPKTITADLYEQQASERLANAALTALGSVDILVNAAGGTRVCSWDAPDEVWEEAMLLNYTRTRQLTHALVPQMIERGCGRVVNLTGTTEPLAANATFPAKSALHGWSKALSRSVAKAGVTVNCIQPGRILTEQMAHHYPTDESRQAFCDTEIPLGRFGEPEEVASLAVFLASPLASYMTGAVIPVDGGFFRFAF